MQQQSYQKEDIMERRHLGVPGAFCLILSMLFLLGCSVRVNAAEVKVKHIAYVDSAGRLILKYEDFSKKGYTWKVYRAKACVKKGKQVFGSKALMIDLGDAYRKNSLYKLILSGKGKKRKLAVYYFTGKYLNSFSVNQTRTGALNFHWLNGKGSPYKVIAVGLTAAPLDTSFLTQVRTEGTNSSMDLAASKLKNGSYQVHLLSFFDYKGKVINGEGLMLGYDYLAEPGKVIGVRSTVNANTVTLSWDAVGEVGGYNISQQVDDGSYETISSNQQRTSITVPNLTGGKTYRFKIAAVNSVKNKVMVGRSALVQVTVPKIASAPQKLLLDLAKGGKIKIRWSTVPDADFYHLYYKTPDMSEYQMFGKTKNTEQVLHKLDPNTRYSIKVYSCSNSQGQVYESKLSSPVQTFVPKEYLGANQWKLAALNVRSVHYGRTRVTYTSKKYPKEVRTAFINYKRYKSKTKYLIWVSLYTQQCNIFEGSRENWKLIRSFTIASGTARNHTPTGVFKLQYKEKGWFYNYTKELYVSHFKGRNAFHTRPLYNNGSVCTPTIGRPASHGCIRCYNDDARFIYQKIPCGTTVVIY